MAVLAFRLSYSISPHHEALYLISSILEDMISDLTLNHNLHVDDQVSQIVQDNTYQGM